MAQEKAAATAATIEEPVSRTMVDDAIASIEKLYETFTGSPPTPGDANTPIPVERDPGEFVGERLERLVDALGQPFAASRAWAPPMVAGQDSVDAASRADHRTRRKTSQRQHGKYRRPAVRRLVHEPGGPVSGDGRDQAAAGEDRREP